MLRTLLAEAAARFGDRPAYVAGDATLTYADWAERSDAVAGALLARGLRPGDVLALTLAPGLDYPVCYLGAAKAGLVTAGVNQRLTAAEQRAVLDVVQPALVVDEVVANELVHARKTGAVEVDPAAPVAVVFTSGTTGLPKAATFGNPQLDFVRHAEAGGEWGRGGRSLFATSPSHLGFMTKIGSSIQNGGTAYFVPRWSADTALRMTAELGFTSISGVPTQLALMLGSPLIEHADLSSVKVVVIGGGPATPALVRAARERLGVPVLTRYSCTEAGLGCGTSATDPHEDAEFTVGRPLPGVELRIDAPDEAGVGEVVLRSPAAMSGYWGDDAATRTAMTADGFVRTGDLGWVDDAGRLRLAGRRSEMWVRGGYNVFPAEVESVLVEHPRVRAVAVVPRPDDVMGQVSVAVVVPVDEAPTLTELRAFAADQLAKHKLPEGLVVLDALPLTAGDKVDRRTLERAVATSRT